MAQNLSYAAPCAATSVYTGLFVRNSGQWEDHNRCFSRTSANKDPAWRNSAVCLFKYPLAVNKPRNEILFRVYDVDSSCRYLGTYKDYTPASNVIRDNAYDEVRSSTVKLENATSRSIVDRNGGTTYEYYSLRGTDVALRAGTFENALHANFGAAMQTVLFGEKLTLTPCGIQGVWNPTQAGATCGTNQAGHIFVKPGTDGLNVICDGLLDNNCTGAKTVLTNTFYRVLNWDYSKAGGDKKYDGPYNAGDTAFLGQTLSYAPRYYSQYDAFWRNVGHDRDVISTAPTLYMNNHWRRISHPNEKNQVVTMTVPENLTGDDSNGYKNYGASGLCDMYDWKWVTAENTYFTTSGKAITLAWFYGPEYQADKTGPYTETCIQEQPVYRTINVWNVPMWHQRTNLAYQFRWVLFPYKYNESIVYAGKTMIVQKAIEQMAKDFAANPPLNRYYDYTTNTHLITAPEHYTPLATLGYLSRAKTAGTTALYSCQNGLRDTFLRTEGTGCGGYPLVHPEGYLYTTPAARRVPLYACLAASSHFASTRADCEGQRVEGLLGFMRGRP